MTVLIEKNSPFFDKEKAQEYFELNRKNLDDVNGFDDLFVNSRFFNIHNHGYIGSVFVYQGQDNKNYIGGYMLRKHHKEAVEATRQVANLFDEVYAYTRHLNAVITLKKAGFKWVNRKNKILKRTKFKEKNNGK